MWGRPRPGGPRDFPFMAYGSRLIVPSLLVILIASAMDPGDACARTSRQQQKQQKQKQNDPQQQQSGRVRGQVIDSRTGQALSRIRVEITGSERITVVETDRQGRCRAARERHDRKYWRTAFARHAAGPAARPASGRASRRKSRNDSHDRPPHHQGDRDGRRRSLRSRHSAGNRRCHHLRGRVRAVETRGEGRCRIRPSISPFR